MMRTKTTCKLQDCSWSFNVSIHHKNEGGEITLRVVVQHLMLTSISYGYTCIRLGTCMLVTSLDSLVSIALNPISKFTTGWASSQIHLR